MHCTGEFQGEFFYFGTKNRLKLSLGPNRTYEGFALM